MAYNTVSGNALKDNDIVLYSQLKGSLTKYIVKNVNAKNTGAILIATTDNNGKRFHPSMISVLISGANAITVPATLSIGTNASTYNDLLASTVLTGLTGVQNMTNYNLVAMINSVPVNTGIYLNVTAGSTATVCNIDVAIFGDYE